MDGRTAHLRAALDDRAHERVPIMSYSTKFASNFYGPFREAAESAPQFGDRRHYQIDVRSRRDAMASSVRCASEGADLLMVKPGMTSLDLIGPIAEATQQAGRGLPGQRRVRGAAGARRAGARVAGRAAARNLACLSPRRRVVHHHVRRARRPRGRTSRMSGHPALYERARRVTPGGVHSPVRAFRSVGGTPVFFAKGGRRAADRRRRPRIHRFLRQLRAAHSRPRGPGRRAGGPPGDRRRVVVRRVRAVFAGACRVDHQPAAVGRAPSGSSRPAPKR